MATTKSQTIELGDKVRDRVTGHTGIATQRVECLNGCIQFAVRPRIKKDGTWPESYCIDLENLEILKKQEVRVIQRPGGGESTKPARSL